MCLSFGCFCRSLCVPSVYVCFCFVLFLFFLYVRVCPTPSQLQEAKQLERERHRQHSPVTQHTEPDSPQLQTHIHPPAKGPTQEANGPVTPPTPSITIPSTPSTPSTPAPEGSSRSVSGEQEEQREREEQGEQGPAYESPDPENGSEFCVAENEQTEADQATAAAQSKTAYRDLFYCTKCQYSEAKCQIQFKMLFYDFKLISYTYTLDKQPQTFLRSHILNISYLFSCDCGLVSLLIKNIWNCSAHPEYAR